MKIALSGGFDPLHAGHLAMIDAAARYGDVYVILNSERWLRQKKGYSLMGRVNRLAVMSAIDNVHDVYMMADDEDMDGTVTKGLMYLHDTFEIDAFGNGGDRILSNTPEVSWCIENGIHVIAGLGGGKSYSSSDLVHKVLFLLEKAGKYDGG